ARRRDVVLEADRDPPEHAAPLGVVEVTRAPGCHLRIDGDVRVQYWIEPVNAFQYFACELGGRHVRFGGLRHGQQRGRVDLPAGATVESPLTVPLGTG